MVVLKHMLDEGGFAKPTLPNHQDVDMDWLALRRRLHTITLDSMGCVTVGLYAVVCQLSLQGGSMDDWMTEFAQATIVALKDLHTYTRTLFL